MVDISYTTLHKRTGEGGWLATPSSESTLPGSISAPGTLRDSEGSGADLGGHLLFLVQVLGGGDTEL